MRYLQLLFLGLALSMVAACDDKDTGDSTEADTDTDADTDVY